MQLLPLWHGFREGNFGYINHTLAYLYGRLWERKGGARTTETERKRTLAFGRELNNIAELPRHAISIGSREKPCDNSKAGICRRQRPSTASMKFTLERGTTSPHCTIDLSLNTELGIANEEFIAIKLHSAELSCPISSCLLADKF